MKLELTQKLALYEVQLGDTTMRANEYKTISDNARDEKVLLETELNEVALPSRKLYYFF